MKNLLVIMLLATLLGCDKNNNENPNSVSLNLNFSHLVDGEDVVFDQIIYKNALDQPFSVKTIKYFITRVSLYKADGEVIALDDVFYVDARTPELLVQSSAQKISQGDYTGISFIYGLVPEDNITGSFPNQPMSLMEWPVPMGGGYHYMKLEGDYITEGNFYNFHTGMLNGTAYEVHVDLKNNAFNVDANQVTLQINMEIQKWFTSPNNWDFTYFGPGIMGNPEAQETVQENGIDVFSFEKLTGVNE